MQPIRLLPGGSVVKIHVRFLRRAKNSVSIAAFQKGRRIASRADLGNEVGRNRNGIDLRLEKILWSCDEWDGVFDCHHHVEKI